MISGSADGEIIMWSIPERKALFQINAHQQFVRGLAFANNSPISADTIFISTGDDRKVHLWSTNKLKKQYEEFGPSASTLFGQEKALSTARNYEPRATYMSKHLLTALDHSYSENLFATGGSVV